MKRSDMLQDLRVASPCHESWERMTGDDRVRYCDSCKLNVYNFSEMTAAEIESLLVKMEGRVCGRMFRRSDGTVLTQDCPVGLRAIRLRVARAAGAAFATLLTLGSVVFGQSKPDSSITQAQIVDLNFQIKSDLTKKRTLTGVVLDYERAKVPGARVTLTRNATREQQITATDDSGNFIFSYVSDGDYSFEVEAPGLRKFQLAKFSLKADEGYVVEVSLLQELELIGLISTPVPIESPDIQIITSPGALRIKKRP